MRTRACLAVSRSPPKSRAPSRDESSMAGSAESLARRNSRWPAPLVKCTGQASRRAKQRDGSDEPWAPGLLLRRRAVARARLRTPSPGRDDALQRDARKLETLYEAVEEGALSIALPKFVKKELEGYLDCGLLYRGFARLKCGDCSETRLVAFSCRGRGFCPSCLGRRMRTPRRRPRTRLLGRLTRIFVESVLQFYTRRMAREGASAGQSGVVVVVQRTSSDMKCNPHLYVVFLDGVFPRGGRRGAVRELPRLSSTEVGNVLSDATKRMAKHLRRKGLVQEQDEEPGPDNELAALTASAVSEVSPPRAPNFDVARCRCRTRPSRSTSRRARRSTASPCMPPHAPERSISRGSAGFVRRSLLRGSTRYATQAFSRRRANYGHASSRNSRMQSKAAPALAPPTSSTRPCARAATIAHGLSS
jgi:hypothetical protein